MEQKKILIVDDEWNMRNMLHIYLLKNGFQPLVAKNGLEALKMLEKYNIDLIILDLMMPDMDGIEVCSIIRKTKPTPIIMLTARSDTKDKVEGLNVGADDYLTKPFQSEELIARVKALLRRENYKTDYEQNHFIQYKDFEIDPDGRQLFIQNEHIETTLKEFSLLYFLASHPGKVFTREQLLYQVWGDDFFGDERTVDSHIKSIRAKFRQAGVLDNIIHTVWGLGYKFMSEGQ